MKYPVLIFTLIVASTFCFGQTKQAVAKPSTISKTVTSKFGALAIDRNNGFYYGWSHDYSTLTEAEQKAIEECKKKGGNCSVVLSYSGTGCAVYRTVDGNVGTAFGWGVAKTKAEADAIAIKECEKRSNGNPSTNFVWSCNGANSGTLKEIYNASEEIAATVKIGNQFWAIKNLDVRTFRNGDTIPEAKSLQDFERFSALGKSAWCYYEYNAANGTRYGKLYNWFAVNDPRGLAPIGWHIPSDNEWTTLTNYLGGESKAGKKMKTTSGWFANGVDGNGTNESNFSGLPGGTQIDDGTFRAIGESGLWWSSTEMNKTNAWFRNLHYGYTDINRNISFKKRAMSVRCIKD